MRHGSSELRGAKWINEQSLKSPKEQLRLSKSHFHGLMSKNFWHQMQHAKLIEFFASNSRKTVCEKCQNSFLQIISTSSTLYRFIFLQNCLKSSAKEKRTLTLCKCSTHSNSGNKANDLKCSIPAWFLELSSAITPILISKACPKNWFPKKKSKGVNDFWEAF